VIIFPEGDVALVAGIKTVYTCKYTSPYCSILNVSLSQSFIMNGGVLICGSSDNDTTLFFTMLSHLNAYFSFCEVNLKFAGTMNSVVYVTGGTVCFERVKMDKQLHDCWVNPLIDVVATAFPVVIQFLYTNITNCYYKCGYSSIGLYKSAVIFFTNTSTDGEVITLNMSSSYFFNSTFDLYNGIRPSCGGVCYFCGPLNSGMFFLL
jgi:hypothetical protein